MTRLLGWGSALVLVGFWIWLSALNVPYMVFSRDWPLLVVALGIYVIVRRATRRRRHWRRTSSVITDLENGRIDVDKAINEIRRSK